MKKISRNIYSPLFGIVAGTIYGIGVRLTYDRQTGTSIDAFMTMTWGFIFLVPFVIGFLTSYFYKGNSWLYLIVAPWLSCLLLNAAAFLLGLEGSICILMATPVFFIMSTGGSLLHALLRRMTGTKSVQVTCMAMLFMPYLTSGIENRFALPQSVRTVDTQIVIHASVQSVWEQIIRVPRISEEEHHFSAFHAVGFPRPVEATLSHPGIGGVRHAIFEGGLVFIETIDIWEESRQLGFSIVADTKAIPATTLDKHVVVGGEYFDTLQGLYTVEQRDAETTILHLLSRNRVSTRFNAYTGLWTDFVMRNIQDYILEIVKQRCETT